MEVFPITNAGHALLIAFGLFAILYDRMWKKLPADHPATIEQRGRLSSADSAGIRKEARRNE
jgi:hypothetical protein